MSRPPRPIRGPLHESTHSVSPATFWTNHSQVQGIRVRALLGARAITGAGSTWSPRNKSIARMRIAFSSGICGDFDSKSARPSSAPY